MDINVTSTLKTKKVKLFYSSLMQKYCSAPWLKKKSHPCIRSNITNSFHFKDASNIDIIQLGNGLKIKLPDVRYSHHMTWKKNN